MFNLTGNFYQVSIEAIPEVQFHQLIWKSHSSGKVRCCKSQQNRVTYPHTENKTRTRLHKFSEKHHECLLDLLDLPRFVLPMHPETVSKLRSSFWLKSRPKRKERRELGSFVPSKFRLKVTPKDLKAQAKLDAGKLHVPCGKTAWETAWCF